MQGKAVPASPKGDRSSGASGAMSLLSSPCSPVVAANFILVDSIKLKAFPVIPEMVCHTHICTGIQGFGDSIKIENV